MAGIVKEIFTVEIDRGNGWDTLHPRHESREEAESYRLRWIDVGGYSPDKIRVVKYTREKV